MDVVNVASSAITVSYCMRSAMMVKFTSQPAVIHVFQTGVDPKKVPNLKKRCDRANLFTLITSASFANAKRCHRQFVTNARAHFAKNSSDTDAFLVANMAKRANEWNASRQSLAIDRFLVPHRRRMHDSKKVTRIRPKPPSSTKSWSTKVSYALTVLVRLVSYQQNARQCASFARSIFLLARSA